MRVMPPKGGPKADCQYLSHANFSAHGFMKKPVLSRDSLGPDLHRSKKKNLRKSAKSVEKKSSVLNSKKIYVNGKLHPDLRVPFREISLAPTKTMSGEIEVNEPVRVYDTSGPWGDPSVTLDPVQGLPPSRREWIVARGDVEEIYGRKVQPIDDGYLSVSHAEHANGSRKSKLESRKPSSFAARKPLRAKNGAVTQLAYARRGIITPEMEFIAIRENCNAEDRGQKTENRNDLGFAHSGSEPICNF